jgi:thiol-disulfide isomerase/thioredoxin
MNYSSTKTLTPLNNGINVIKTGGNNSLVSKIYSFFNWKILLIILFIIICLLVGYYSYKNYTTSKTNFQANRENSPGNGERMATLMLFYVDWCPHCKTAKPEWESLKEQYEGKEINGYKLSFIEHNCTNESEEVTSLMDKYNIEGYPTIKLLKDNQIIEYDAKPTKSTMDQFLHTVL